MKTTLKYALLLAGMTSLPAMAHISYTNRDFGTFDGSVATSVTIANQAATGNFGWADGADADWGDSHKVKWFKFTLSNAADVKISVAAKADATGTSIAGLIPGFSLYKGLASAAAYDTSAASLAYRATLGFPVEGVFNALGNWKAANDSGVFGELTFVDYAADGSADNFGYGTAAVGDGTYADGYISKTLTLAAGTYTLGIGGAAYSAQDPLNPNAIKGYGISATVATVITTPVPEPETYALLLAGLGVLGAVARRRI